MLSASAFAFAGVDLRTSAQRPKKAVKILPLATPLAFQVAGATVAEAEPMPERTTLSLTVVQGAIGGAGGA